MTAMTARLRDMGLVERLPDQNDSRAWNLQISDDGRAALKRIEQPFRRINQKIEAALDGDEISRLADYASRIGDAFEEP
jgi:MarR family transcriptional regulator, organic hydroperoxide resistance regulator